MLQKTKELTIPNETKGFMMLKNFDANETIAKEMEGLTTVFEKINNALRRYYRVSDAV